MLVFSYKPYELIFNEPGGTSRGILHTKMSWYVWLWHDTNSQIKGMGEVSILPNLSPETPEMVEQTLNAISENPAQYATKYTTLLSNTPAVKFGFETALSDLNAGGRRVFKPTPFTKNQQGIKINGLIWMGNKDEMRRRIAEKLDAGFHCLKLKIGAINFADELDLLSDIRKAFNPETLEIRVDANGAFAVDDCLEKLEALTEFNLHSIEQPIKQGQIEAMATICKKSPIPVALDEELIGCTQKEALINAIKPHYIIIKPSLVGGLTETSQWAKLAEANNIGWWVTSALESNVGLNAIAQWVFENGSAMPQGLGTGKVFTNNIASPLYLKADALWYNPNVKWEL